MTSKPTLAAPYTQGNLATDEFDHHDWSKAEPIQITRKWSGEAAPESRHAEARVLWSDDSLLVRFVCRQIEPLIVSASPELDKKTRGLWDRDVCEIFIAPDAEHPDRYFEFEAAPTGEWLDLAIQITPDGRETDWQFFSGMSTAARMAGQQLTVTIRIPWTKFIPRPQRGDTWRANLFRCIGKGDDRYLAWQPTHSAVPNFHVPEVFGWLQFD